MPNLHCHCRRNCSRQRMPTGDLRRHFDGRNDGLSEESRSALRPSTTTTSHAANVNDHCNIDQRKRSLFDRDHDSTQRCCITTSIIEKNAHEIEDKGSQLIEETRRFQPCHQRMHRSIQHTASPQATVTERWQTASQKRTTHLIHRPSNESQRSEKSLHSTVKKTRTKICTWCFGTYRISTNE